MQLEYAIFLHETVLMYDSEKILWTEEKSRIRGAQMDNLRGLLGIRKKDKVSNAQIMELCRVKKGLDERVDEDEIQWFSHVERME